MDLCVPDQLSSRAAQLRWAFDLQSVNVTGLLSELVHLLPVPEQAAIRQYVRDQDRARALISRIMQRACACSVLGIPWPEVRISRNTKGGKPFVANTWRPANAPNFNYNVSHEGDFVALASEGLCLCGVDVAAPQQADLVRKISAAEGPAKGEACFVRLWSLKEAYVKARGDGLGFSPLSRAEFVFDHSDAWADSASVIIDNMQPSKQWRFTVEDLPRGHWVSVARGSPQAALDEYGDFIGSMKAKDLPEAQLLALLATSSPRFELISLARLVPDDFDVSWDRVLSDGANQGT